MTFNDNQINVPRVVTIKLKDKIKIRYLMKKEPLLFHIMHKHGITWFTWAHMNDNIANYPDGLYSQTRMQLLTWVFQVPSAGRNYGC